MRAKCNKTKYLGNSRHRLSCALRCHHSNELAVPNSALPPSPPKNRTPHRPPTRRSLHISPSSLDAPRFCPPHFSCSLTATCRSAEFSTTPLLPPGLPSPAPPVPPSTHRCPTCLPSPTLSPSLLFIPANTRARAPSEITLLPPADIPTNPSRTRAQADGTLIRATMSTATSFRWVPVEAITRNVTLVQLLPVPSSRSTVRPVLITRRVKMNMLQRNGRRRRTSTRITNLLVQDAYVPSP